MFSLPLTYLDHVNSSTMPLYDVCRVEMLCALGVRWDVVRAAVSLEMLIVPLIQISRLRIR